MVYFSGEAHQRLTIQAGHRDDSAKTLAARKIESDYFVLRNAVDMPVRSEPAAARFLEFGQSVWPEDTDEATIHTIIFPNSGHSTRRTEGPLATNKNVAIRRDGEVEWAEFRILYKMAGPGALVRSE
jgi:hypothetical protein